MSQTAKVVSNTAGELRITLDVCDKIVTIARLPVYVKQGRSIEESATGVFNDFRDNHGRIANIVGAEVTYKKVLQ